MKVKPWRLLSLLLAGALCGLALFFIWRGPADGPVRVLKLGVSEGAPEIISDYLLEHHSLAVETVSLPLPAVPLMEVQAFPDCCSNSTQMALGAGEVDMAVLCSDAAAALINNDPHYQEIGTWIAGSDVLVSRAGQPVRTAAFASGRNYQEAMIRATLGDDCVLQPLMPSAIAYALERGEIDAGIMDAVKARQLPDGFAIQPLAEHSANRYVLVAHGDIIDTAAFAAFMEAWKQSAADLQDPQVLETAVESMDTAKSERKEGELWSQLNVKIPLTTWSRN